MNKKTYVSFFIAIFGIFSLIIGITYALFISGNTSNEVQVIKTGSLNLTLTESGDIELLDLVALTDEEGLTQDSYYEFDLTNNGDIDANYKVYLMDDADKIIEYTGTLLDDKYIRFSIEVNNLKYGVMSLEEVNRLLNEKKLQVGQTDNYKLRLWLNFDALTEDEIASMEGQSIFLKLKITAEQVFKTQYPLLADKIMEQGVVTTGSGLYASTDTNSGKPTYYYKGAVENNYVSFAGYTWRVIRINEDGTVRLIMEDGINNTAYYAFNLTNNEYKYMYYSESNVDGGAMKRLEDWYDDKLSSYDSLIATSTYCEQAKVKYGSDATSGNATMELYDNYTSDFRCKTDENEKGIVNSKIGLVSIDELLHAGGIFYTNNDYYLVNGQWFWTISPSGFDSNTNYARAWYASLDGNVDRSGVINVNVLRSVISLKAGTLVSGRGTSDNPWIVKNS